MDLKLPNLPVQGVSDLNACYNHALAGLIRAGTDLDRVGTELNRAQVTFHNAIDQYFNQLQLQIDNKDKTIRLLLEQKVETYDVMISWHNQLAKLQDEKSTLQTENDYLTKLLKSNPSGTGDVLPLGMSQENFSGNSSTDLFCPHIIIHNNRNLRTILTAFQTTEYSKSRIEHLVYYLMAQIIQL